MKYFRVVSWLRHLITRVKSQASPYGICGGQNFSRTGFPPQFHSTKVSHAYLHLSLMLLSKYQCCYRTHLKEDNFPLSSSSTIAQQFFTHIRTLDNFDIILFWIISTNILRIKCGVPISIPGRGTAFTCMYDAPLNNQFSGKHLYRTQLILYKIVQ